MAYTVTECLGMLKEMFFPTPPKWEKLTFSKEAWVKLMCYINLIGDYEITGFGRVVDNRIIDIKILRQEVKPATVDCDVDAMQDFLFAIPREEMGQWVLDWHSHVDMGVSPSGTDTSNYKEQWKARLNNQFPLLIVNKSQHCHAECYISPSRSEEIKMFIEQDGDLTQEKLTEIYEECKKNVEELCTKHEYKYERKNNYYNRNYGMGYGYGYTDYDDEVVDYKKKESTTEETSITSSNDYQDFCWGCGEYLVGAEEYDRHVCDDCWEKMTPSEQQDWLLAYKNI